MNDVEVTEVAPSYDALERAIACVPGVVSASVTRSQTTGRSRLRIRVSPGEHAESVSWAVAATLRERFGIALDPDEIRPRLEDDSDVAAGGHRPQETEEDPVRLVDAHDEPVLSETRDRLTSAARAALVGIDADDADHVDAVPTPSPEPGPQPVAHDRPEIRHLDTRSDAQTVTATATLTHRGRIVHGEGSSVPTTHGILRAVAEATVDALRALTGSVLLAGVDAIIVQASGPGSVTVVATMLTERGEETMLGTSVVRRDTEHAVMRATLDALNRRVALMLDAGDRGDMAGQADTVDTAEQGQRT